MVETRRFHAMSQLSSTELNLYSPTTARPSVERMPLHKRFSCVCVDEGLTPCSHAFAFVSGSKEINAAEMRLTNA
jgi:hypothetical protein